AGGVMHAITAPLMPAARDGDTSGRRIAPREERWRRRRNGARASEAQRPRGALERRAPLKGVGGAIVPVSRHRHGETPGNQDVPREPAAAAVAVLDGSCLQNVPLMPRGPALRLIRQAVPAGARRGGVSKPTTRTTTPAPAAAKATVDTVPSDS